MTSEADDILTKIIQREIHRRAGNVTTSSNSLQKQRKKKLLLKKKKKKEKTIEAVAKINTVLPKKVKKHKGPTIYTDVYTKKTKIADATIQNADLNNLEKNENEELLSKRNNKDIKKKSKHEKSFTCDQENKVKYKVYDIIPSKIIKNHKHQTVVHVDDTHHKNINICEKPSQFYSVVNTPYTKNRPGNNDVVAATITSNNSENMGMNSLLVKKKKKKKNKKKQNIGKKLIEENEYDTKIHAVNNDIAATTLTSNNTESIEINSVLLKTLVKKLKKKKKEKIKVAGVLGIMSPKKSKKHKQLSSCDLYDNEDLENDISAVLTDEKSIDKIYKCDVCKMTFTFLSTLKKHKAKAHIVDNDTVALFDSSKCSNDYKMLKSLKKILKEPKNLCEKAKKKDILLNASPKKQKKIRQQSMCNQRADNDVTVHHADDMLITKCHKCKVCKTVVHSNTSLNAEDDKEITLLLEKNVK